MRYIDETYIYTGYFQSYGLQSTVTKEIAEIEIFRYLHNFDNNYGIS